MLRKTSQVRSPIPVTLLSGFLGSGKTTMLLNILRNKDNLRCAVIVNDMASFNVDGSIIEKSNVMQQKEELIQFQNGCICCTLRGDLLRGVANLAKSNKFDYIIIESTGISEPMQVAETFLAPSDAIGDAADVGFESLIGIAKLDTCVTVVDTSNFFHYLDNTKFLNQEFKDAEEDDTDRSVANLLVEQIEFADVIVLNKIAMVKDETLKKIKGFIKQVNPKAEMIATNYSKVSIDKLINTGKFNIENAQQANGWMKSLTEGHTPETEEYGISHFLYKESRPFHPMRLYAMIKKYFYLIETSYANEEDHIDEEESQVSNNSENNSDDDKDEESFTCTNEDEEENAKRLCIEARNNSPFRGLLRSKGFFMLATRPDAIGSWAQTGNTFTIDYAGPVKETEVEDNESKVSDEEECHDETNDDNKSKSNDNNDLEVISSLEELVFIGSFKDNDKDMLLTEINNCLLTDEEMVLFEDGKLESFEDPWEDWPEGSIHNHDTDEKLTSSDTDVAPPHKKSNYIDSH